MIEPVSDKYGHSYEKSELLRWLESSQTSPMTRGPLTIQDLSDNLSLKRSIDYQVDYFSGTIVLADDVDPNAEIKVIYDKHQLVTFDKKTILGVRSQMDFGKNSFMRNYMVLEGHKTIYRNFRDFFTKF